jgi:hypothetical protein
MTRPVLIAALLGSACFQPWAVDGLYRCGGGCPEGFTCDDDVCCVPGGAPVCPTLVLDGGLCPDGGTPKTYWADLDMDGFGNPAAPKLACSKPVSAPYADNPNDCDDTSAAAHPGGTEVCDGRDNNCNGQIDEGQSPLKAYYRDVDGDGYGDDTMTLMACACPSPCVPPGYAAMGGDCAPMDPSRHPGAMEQCNGLDDNCNGTVDEPPVADVGTACVDGGLGLCGPGTLDCTLGRLTCRSTYLPTLDVCDGIDNNCDGRVDEQPDCGGPPSLIGAGVVNGAQDLGSALSFTDQTSRCLKNWPGASNESWAKPRWSGSGSNDHIWWAEAPAGVTWDLSKPGLRLNLAFSWTMTSPASPDAWALSKQPVVYLCGVDGGAMERFVHIPGTLLTNTPGPVTSTVDFGALGQNTWDLGASTGLDLTKVKRVELMVEPAYKATAPLPTFTFTFFADGGFE